MDRKNAKAKGDYLVAELAKCQQKLGGQYLSAFPATWFDRLVERILSRMISFYSRTLDHVLERRGLTLLVFVLTIVLTGFLFVRTPKGYFPQEDTGLLFGTTRASTDISYDAMEALQLRAVIARAQCRSHRVESSNLFPLPRPTPHPHPQLYRRQQFAVRDGNSARAHHRETGAIQV